MESVKELLGHASITTTIDTYGNPRELHRMSENSRSPGHHGIGVAFQTSVWQ